MKARLRFVSTLILGAVATNTYADGDQPGTTTPTPFVHSLEFLPDWDLIADAEDFAAFSSIKSAKRERDVVTIWERWE